MREYQCPGYFRLASIFYIYKIERNK
uniref:Uncharacterized protein n=1 Tax=Anguilla anguilla TaxID=7936 RepID=A0A0E9R2N8_ANGAN